MKVCVLTHTYPRFPGDTNGPFVEHLSESIQKLGHHVTVLTAYDSAFNRGTDDHKVDLRTYKYIFPDRLHILGYSRTIEADIKLKKRVFLLAPLLFLCSFLSLFKLGKEKNPDVIHAHWILPNGFIGALVSRILKIPLVITLHGSGVFTAERNIVFGWLAKVAFRRAGRIASCSPDLRDRLIRMGADPDKIVLVPNGTNPQDFEIVPGGSAAVWELRSKLGIPAGNKIILAVGRLVYKKGFEYLLRAVPSVLARRKDISVIVAGEGELANALRTLASELGIMHHILFPGRVLRGEIPSYFALCDIFVMPSIRDEKGNIDGLPVVVLEAMAAGKPVVASKISGIPLAVTHHESGLLVEERSPLQIAEALLELLDSDGMRERFGATGRRRIETELNWARIAERMVELFQCVSEGKRERSEP